jgi:hypothetical protein
VLQPELATLKSGDYTSLPEHREELAEIIVMLRRGEVPTVKRDSTSVDSESGRSYEEGMGLGRLHLRLASEAAKRNRERKKIRNEIE